MEKKMIDIGEQMACKSLMDSDGELELYKTYLGYDHKLKIAVLVQDCDRTCYLKSSKQQKWAPISETIDYFHEKYYYPNDMKGKTVKLELKK